MSIIAAMLLAAAPDAAKVPMTAAQALAKYRAATSIGPDPCRAPAGDQIVVCGRRESPYALPLYDATEDDDASQYGGNRVRQMQEVRRGSTRCAAQGLACTEGGLNVLAIGDFVIKGVKALIDDE